MKFIILSLSGTKGDLFNASPLPEVSEAPSVGAGVHVEAAGQLAKPTPNVSNPGVNLLDAMGTASQDIVVEASFDAITEGLHVAVGATQVACTEAGGQIMGTTLVGTAVVVLVEAKEEEVEEGAVFVAAAAVGDVAGSPLHAVEASSSHPPVGLSSLAPLE